MFSSQRLFDIQKQLGSRDRRKIDPELATEVAQRAEAKTMLMGRLMQVGSKLILTSQLVDVLEGTIVGSQRTDGTDLYAMVDNLAVQIHNDLNLPATKLDRVDVAVKEKTTSSTEAYQYYLAGGDLLNESKFDSAIVQFKKAISIDSTFNQAYYKMAIAQWWSSAALGNATDEQAEESLSHILTSDRQTTHKQKLLTEGALALVQDRDIQAQSIFQQVVKEYPDEKEAWYGLGEAYFHGTGENLKSLDAFERALKLDPEFKLAYRHIFDIYYNEELFDRGIDRFRQFVTYYPSESQGYRYLGSMYRAKGEFDLAIENYQKAIENNPKDYKPKELLGLTYNLMGQYDKAVKKYHELFRPEVPLINQYYGKRFLSFVYAEQGQFRKAIEVMEESQYIGKSISIDREGNAVVWLGTLHFRLGDIEAAMSLFDSALVIDQSIVYLLWANSVKGAILARLGDKEALSTIIDEVQDRIEVKGVESEAKYAYNALLTEHFHLQGEIERALMELNNVKHSKAWADWLLHKEAMLHLENRSFDKAIDLSHDMQSPNVHGYSRFFNYPLGFYVRGRAYEAMGDLDLARENYEALLSLWQDGDEEIPERQDAIKRLSRIIKVQG
ncbi:MAG: tetratricopeptide repeat protein [Candidatus Marinimicrobia bacterium]|nr:tetratricopeptide repeat protein [Candidatus Neomarinimicrobiota bacterium]